MSICVYQCGVFLQVQKCHSRSDGYLGDICDGSLYKSHTLFSSSDNGVSLALQFIIYYDELEIANPLGSSKEKHKLGKQFHV